MKSGSSRIHTPNIPGTPLLPFQRSDVLILTVDEDDVMETDRIRQDFKVTFRDKPFLL